MIKEKINKVYKHSYRPYYDKRHKLWKVDFTDRASEEGPLWYVASEYSQSGLYFPYNDSSTMDKDYNGHDHFFEGVIEALLEDPKGFTIAGFEEYYSVQERELLAAIQTKLLEKPVYKKHHLLKKIRNLLKK